MNEVECLMIMLNFYIENYIKYVMNLNENFIFDVEQE